MLGRGEGGFEGVRCMSLDSLPTALTIDSANASTSHHSLNDL